MLRLSTLPILERSIPRRGLSFVGGKRLSKFSRRRASRAATGVLPATGVRFQDELTWAGLGDMLRKSAKLRLVEGVCKPKPGKAAPPPGVDIIEDGSGVDLGGGVDGASIRGFESPWRAGEGEAARYIRRPASLSPFCSSRTAAAAVKPFCLRRADRARPGGGVRGILGGEDRKALN